MTGHNIIESGRFKYTESGHRGGPPIILLHGLLGALSNFEGIIKHFSSTHNVVVPILPIFERLLRVPGELVQHLDWFCRAVSRHGTGRATLLLARHFAPDAGHVRPLQPWLVGFESAL